jgi:hypothetical protein
MGFELAPDYVDVAQRMREFFEKHPEGSLQTVEISPWTFGDKDFIAYTAAAYRAPDDPRPGYGVAWEPVPGQTPYTRNSELMNAETSAWGRAILAVGASTSKQIASANEVRNRADEPEQATRAPQRPARGAKGVRLAPPELTNRIEALIASTGKYKDWDEAMMGIVGEPRGRAEITFGEARNVKSTLEHLQKEAAS